MNPSKIRTLALLALSALPLNSSPALAGDEDHHPMIEVGAGVYHDEEATAFLIRATFGGIRGASGATYFWVKTQSVLGREPGEDEAGAVELEVEVVPVTLELRHVLEGNLRILPIQLGRDLELGVKGRASFEVLGWSSEDEDEEAARMSAPGQVRKLRALGEVAIDAIGLSCLRMSDGGAFSGAQLARGEIEAGLEYRVSSDRAIRLVAEIEGGAGYGHLDAAGARDAGVYAIGSEASLELQYWFSAMRGHYGLFAQAVYERIDFTGAPRDRSRGEPNLRVGISGRF